MDEKTKTAELLDFDLETIKDQVPEDYSSVIALFKEGESGFGLGIGFQGEISNRKVVAMISALVERLVEEFDENPEDIFKEINAYLLRGQLDKVIRHFASEARKRKEKDVEGE